VSLERKLRRAKANKAKKASEKELATKVALFGKISNNGFTCEKPCYKRNREQVMTCNVVVRQKEEKVNLYCPDCWEKAINVIKGLQERFKEKS